VSSAFLKAATVPQQIRVIRVACVIHVPLGFNDTTPRVNDAGEPGKIKPKRSLKFMAKY